MYLVSSILEVVLVVYGVVITCGLGGYAAWRCYHARAAITSLLVKWGWWRKLSASTMSVMSFMERIDGDDCSDEDESDEEDNCDMPEAEPLDGTGDAVKQPRQRPPQRKRPVEKDELGLPRFWYDLARKAKLKWGALPMDSFNANAVQRYLLRELEGKKGIRQADVNRYMQRMVLYVFYRTDRERQFDLAVEELDAHGLIRRAPA